MSQTTDSTILYQTAKNKLLYQKNELLFIDGENIYQLSSHPYEPCLFIKQNNQIIKILHHSFTIDEIVDVAKGKYLLKTVTGNEYDVAGICNLFLFVIHASKEEIEIDELEKQTVIIINEKDVEKKTCIEEKSEEGQPFFLETMGIKELTDDLFYKEYAKYEDCVLDYCILKMATEYHAEESHKDAVLFAMQKWKAIMKEEYEIDIHYHSSQMKAKKVEAETFFEISTAVGDTKTKSYWELFIKPPHGNSYTTKDFEYINQLLFPNGIKDLEIYDWSTDWSNYFENGLEWWGARCVSIYDKTLKRYIVIGASATD